MNQKEFEDKYKEMIPQASLEDILDLFKEKKIKYSGNKFSLYLQKIKDKFSKKKFARFLELGYRELDSFNFLNSIYDMAIQYDRADMITYLLKNDFIKNFNTYFYLRKLFDSEKVFNIVLSDVEITDKITPNEYAEMLRYCSVKNKVDKFDILCDMNKEKLKLIDKYHLDQIIIESAKNNSKEMLLKLLHMKEPLLFDINAKTDNQFSHIYSRENVLIASVRNNNLEMIKYLLVSTELEKHVDLSESFNYLLELPNGKEIIDYIIFEIKAPLTHNLEILLENNKYLETFKKRDLMLKIEEKLPAKNQKTKVRKI